MVTSENTAAGNHHDIPGAREPLVSIVIPCRNEVRYIESCLRSIMNQRYPKDRMEVLVVDGRSDDGTRSVIDRITGEFPAVRLIDNPERSTPFGLNHGIRAARGEFIVRMDVHTEYDADYVMECIRVHNETGADNVGGPWHPDGRSYMQRAIALAFISPFSSGGARSHSATYEGPVDSVYLGCWKKSFLESIGLFDEDFVRNQDDELNLRIIRSGGRVWQSPRIRSVYYPRTSVRALFNQYAQYGYWKVRVIQKHKLPASIRHLVPAAFVLAILLLAVIALVSSYARWTLAGLLALYAGAVAAASVMVCRTKDAMIYLPVMPLIFSAYHIGYGYGFLRGIVDFIIFRSGPRRRFQKLTRAENNERRDS